MDNAVETTIDGTQKRTHTITMNGVPPKNIKGDLGPRCKWCSGLGFTNAITGGSHSCKRCDSTGIEPQNPVEANASMQRQIDDLREIVLSLVQEIKGTEK